MTDQTPQPSLTPAERIAKSPARIAELLKEREQKVAARIIRQTQRPRNGGRS